MNLKNKYYQLYMKYKAEYLQLKTQNGGKFVEDQIENSIDSNTSALDEIVIRLTNQSGDDVIYKKIIKVNVGSLKGYVNTKNYRLGTVNRHQVNRHEIQNLLNEIDLIWKLPAPEKNFMPPEFRLSVTYGNNEWPDTEKKQSRLSKSDDPDDIYDDIVTKVLNFE